MISLSGMVLLGVLGMIMLYAYELYAIETDNLKTFRLGMAAKNFAVSRAAIVADDYQRSRALWQQDMARAQSESSYSYAYMADSQAQLQQSEAGSMQMTAQTYLMRSNVDEALYILSVHATADDVQGQVRLYLQNKDGEAVVQRWER